MLLYVVRHAWAESAGDVRWPNDNDRPLTDKGRRRFAEMVKMLSRGEFCPRLVATSPALRCFQTAEILAKGLSGKTEVVEVEALASPANLRGLLEWTQEAAGENDELAWVGHAPDVGHLTAALIGVQGGSIGFSKGAIAAIQFDGHPAAVRGELEWLVTAKVLGC